MASTTRESGTERARTQHGRTTGEEIGSPISNEAYNIIAALHAKLEGLEAYRKYSRDGDMRIWQQLSQADRQAVELLVDELERLVEEGKFRTNGGGQS